MHGKTPEDFGFTKIVDRGNSGFVYEKQTPDFDDNPRLTADRYGGSEEWLVKLELPSPDGGLKEVGAATAFHYGAAENRALDLLREHYE